MEPETDGLPFQLRKENWTVLRPQDGQETSV